MHQKYHYKIPQNHKKRLGNIKFQSSNIYFIKVGEVTSWINFSIKRILGQIHIAQIIRINLNNS